MSNGPTEYARATGVTEENRQCDECKKTFRATASKHDHACPFCNSPATRPVTGMAHTGGAQRVVAKNSAPDHTIDMGTHRIVR